MNWSVTRLCSESRVPRRWYFHRIESHHEDGGTTLLRNIGYYVSASEKNVYLPSLMIEVPDRVYVLGDTYTCHTYFFTRIGCTLLTCDMYMCRLRHTYDPVLLSLKMEGIRLLYLTAYMPVSAILVTRRV
jgi:hypothetical protein